MDAIWDRRGQGSGRGDGQAVGGRAGEDQRLPVRTLVAPGRPADDSTTRLYLFATGAPC